MIRSMTGYGEAVGPTAAGRLRIELRAVNHRYFSVNTRLPAALSRWEVEIQNWLRTYFLRGHINCNARWEPSAQAIAQPGFELDEERVREYLRLFHELGAHFGVEGTPDLALLARYNDIFIRKEEDEAAVVPEAAEVQAIIAAAAQQAVRMREDEGKRLEIDLRERLASIESALARIAERAPHRLRSEHQRLTVAVAELLAGVALDEARIAQEIAILAERWDLNEELVRFRSHLELFSDLLDAPDPEPVGKRLSFLVQEMHREANTISSKANDAEISHTVVGIKDEVEKLREQVENVE